MALERGQVSSEANRSRGRAGFQCYVTLDRRHAGTLMPFFPAFGICSFGETLHLALDLMVQIVDSHDDGNCDQKV